MQNRRLLFALLAIGIAVLIAFGLIPEDPVQPEYTPRGTKMIDVDPAASPDIVLDPSGARDTADVEPQLQVITDSDPAIDSRTVRREPVHVELTRNPDGSVTATPVDPPELTNGSASVMRAASTSTARPEAITSNARTGQYPGPGEEQSTEVIVSEMPQVEESRQPSIAPESADSSVIFAAPESGSRSADSPPPEDYAGINADVAPEDSTP